MLHKNGHIAIFYETYGDVQDASRPWIVFAHSLACSSGMWTGQVAEFAMDHRVLVFDTRGHGQSSAPEPGPNGENYRFDDLASDLETLLDKVGIVRPHLVGLSMGGMLGQAFALKYPGRLKSLTVADSVCEWPAGTNEAFMARVVTARKAGMQAIAGGALERWFTPAFRQSNPAEVDKIAQMIRSTPIDGYAGCSYSIPRVNFTARLKDIDAPILVMAGRHDPATTVDMAQQIHAAAPGSSICIIENASHLSNVERPQAFNAAVRTFLREQ